MKKTVALAGLVLAVGMFGAVRSAYCASDPGTQPGKLNIGLEQDYIFERDMNNGDIPLSPGVTMETNVKGLGMTMVRVGYQLSNNLNVYTKLGVTNYGGRFGVTLKGPTSNGTFTEKYIYEGENDVFTWGLGVKLSFPLGNNWIFGADAKYLSHENDYNGKRSVRYFDPAGVLLPEFSEDSAKRSCGSATISEWHVAALIARDFGNFVPYIGAKYSDLQIEEKGADTFNAENNVGVFVGADFKFNKNFSLNLEGRFIDETAMSLAANFAF